MAVDIKKIKTPINRKTKRNGLSVSKKGSSTSDINAAYQKLKKNNNLKTNNIQPGMHIKSEIFNSLNIKVRQVNKKKTLLNEEEPSDSITNYGIDKSNQLSKLNKNMTNLENQIPDNDDPFYKPDSQKPENYKKQVEVTNSIPTVNVQKKAEEIFISMMYSSGKVKIL